MKVKWAGYVFSTELCLQVTSIFCQQAQAYIDEARQIRKEQDEAFQQSLEADKARDKAKAEREELQDV